MDKEKYTSMEEYEANGKTTLFDPKRIRTAIYDIILSRFSKDATMNPEEIKSYVNSIIDFNKEML